MGQVMSPLLPLLHNEDSDRVGRKHKSLSSQSNQCNTAQERDNSPWGLLEELFKPGKPNKNLPLKTNPSLLITHFAIHKPLLWCCHFPSQVTPPDKASAKGHPDIVTPMQRLCWRLYGSPRLCFIYINVSIRNKNHAVPMFMLG